MSAFAHPKRTPGRAFDAMGRSDPTRDHGPVLFDQSPDQVLSDRLRRAFSDWSRHTDQGRDAFADHLGLSRWKVKKLLATNGGVRQDPGVVLKAEALAQEARPAVSDEALLDAWKSYELAKRNWEEKQALWRGEAG